MVHGGAALQHARYLAIGITPGLELHAVEIVNDTLACAELAGPIFNVAEPIHSSPDIADVKPLVDHHDASSRPLKLLVDMLSQKFQ